MTTNALLGFLLAVTIVIVVHELGHYLAARAAGVRVLRFSVGFGRPLALWRRGAGRTEWVLAPIPMGGYVRLLDERNPPAGGIAPEELARSYTRASASRRAAILVAGPGANFVFAAVLLAAAGAIANPGGALWTAALAGIAFTAQQIAATVAFVGQLLIGAGSMQMLAGPVGIAQASGAALAAGPQAFFYLLAMLSVSIGVINLVPLPMLDGGQLVLLGIERLRGRPLAQRTVQWVSMASIAALAVLFVAVTASDVMRIVHG